MGALVSIDLELIKEAKAAVDSMEERLNSYITKNQALEAELGILKEAAEREKIADILDEKSLVPYDKVVALRDGKISKTEYESLKKIAEINMDYISKEHQPTKTAGESFMERSENAADTRRYNRAMQLQEDLEALRNNF